MLHFYLLSIIPILHIYSKNLSTFSLQVLLLPLASILLVCLLLNIFIATILKKRDQWFLLFSCLSLLFWFSWPSAVVFTKLVDIQNNFILTYKFSILTFALLLSIIACYWTIRTFNLPLKKINTFLNIFSFFLIIYQLLNIFIFIQNDSKHTSECYGNQENIKYPNIYHIILDAYTNKEILAQLYNYDNSNFYNELKLANFNVFENAYSNYGSTTPSINSMLRMQYFNKMEETHPETSIPVWDHLQNKGYTLHNSIAFIARNNYPSIYLKQENKINSSFLFLIACFNCTPIHHTLHNLFLRKVYKAHIDEIDETLSFLEDAQNLHGLNNNYFYAHIMNPHEPFVFDGEGNISTKQTYEGLILQKKLNLANDERSENSFKEGYTNQIKAINKRVLNTINKILRQYPEDSKPIIILHADHGRSSRFIFRDVWLTEKEKKIPSLHIRAHWGILLAIYGVEATFPHNLTLVNLYKYVFNNLFFENNTYLENKHFAFTADFIQYNNLN